jgi:hypothetical protein
MVMKVMWRGIGLISSRQLFWSFTILFVSGYGVERGDEEGSDERKQRSEQGDRRTRAKQYPHGFIEKNKRIAKR